MLLGPDGLWKTEARAVGRPGAGDGLRLGSLRLEGYMAGMSDLKTQIAKLPSLQIRFDDFIGHGKTPDGARGLIMTMQGERRTVINFPIEVAHRLAAEAVACVPAPPSDDGGPAARAGFHALALEAGRTEDGKLVLTLFLHDDGGGALTVALDAADEARLAAALTGQAAPTS